MARLVKGTLSVARIGAFNHPDPDKFRKINSRLPKAYSFHGAF